MPPVPSELHVDRWLTNLSVGFSQNTRDFISDKIFPVVSVNKQSDKYIIFNRGDFWRDGQIHERPLGGKLDTVDWGKTEDTYLCVERGASHKIDDRQKANVDDPMDLTREAMELLTSLVMIDNERRFMEKYFAPSIWTTDLDGPGDYVIVDTPNTGTPIETVDVQREKMKKLTALDPNIFILGQTAFRKVKNHDRVKDVFKYTRTGIVGEELLALVFGVDKLFVPRAVSNVSPEGAADSFDFISTTAGAGGPEDALLVYAAPRPGLFTPSAGYTFAWTGLIPGQTNPLGGVIMSGRDEFAHSDHIEIRQSNDIKLVSADLGIYMQDFVA